MCVCACMYACGSRRLNVRAMIRGWQLLLSWRYDLVCMVMCGILVAGSNWRIWVFLALWLRRLWSELIQNSGFF